MKMTTKERIGKNLPVATLAPLFVLATGTMVFAQATGNRPPAGAQITNPSAVDLTGVFTAPAAQTYKLPNGRTMTAAEIRAALDAQIAAKLKGSFVSARRSPSAKVDPAKLAQESAGIFAEMKAATQSSNVPAPPNGTTGRAPTNTPLPGAVGSTIVQQQAQAKLTSVQPCSERSPYIASFKGTITPGGAIGLTGVCFGNEGLVRIFSANPGPNANLLLELHPAWTDTALAVTIPPDITGQIDQPVQVEIVRGDGKKSADLNKVFIAARDPEIEVPANLVVSVQCGNPAGSNPAGCGNRQAVHYSGVQDTAPDLVGTDVWKVQLAKGWQLTTLSTYNDYGVQTPIPESGFEVGPPEAATFQYNWGSAVVTVPCSVLGIPGLCVSQQYALAKYSIMVNAIGPRGVSMYPSK